MWSEKNNTGFDLKSAGQMQLDLYFDINKYEMKYP